MKKLCCIAMFALAVLTFASVSTASEKMSQSTFDELLKKVEAGDAEAQYILGGMCYVGEGVKQDYEQAVYWFKKAAEQGHVKAQYILGSMYDEGKDVKQDYEQAVEWYRKAAEQGYAEAQFSLGLMYDVGKGVKQDDEKAKYWYSKAVENGHEGAKLPLAVLESAEQYKKSKPSTVNTQTQPQPSASESVIEVGTEQLRTEYAGNKIAARRKYDGKKIRLSGFISNIDEDDDKEIYVRLTEEKDGYDGIRCYFNESGIDSVMNLKKGQTVTIEGTCRSGENMWGATIAQLERCRVVNATQPTYQASAPSASTPNTTAIAIDDNVKEFMQRENIPYSIAGKGDVYLLRSYTSQFKAVNGNTAYIYSEPDTSSMAVLKLDNGAKLIADAEYVGKDGSDWYYVHFGDSARGWVQSQYITDRDPDDNSSDNSSESSETNFSLSDAEYKQMMKNSDFAKADKALNNAWQNAKKSMNANSFNKLKQEQNEWISSGRDSWANSLSDYYDRAVAYAIVTETRANYISMRARGCSAAYVTGDKVNVRSKPNTKGRVLFQVSRYIHEEPERLIIDGNFSRDSKGDIWYKVLYVFSYTPDSGDWGYCETNGWINGRFISSTPLEEKDYDLLMSAYSD